MKAKPILIITSLLVFLALFGASVWQESPMLLYIASALPIFIVPLLPDLRTTQRLSEHNHSTQIVKLTDGEGAQSEWLVVNIKPDTIYWNKKWLIIPTADAKPVDQGHTDDYTVSLTVLKYDIRAKRSRSGKIAVNLPNLQQRMAGLSFTTDEVNRLMIRMEDVQEWIATPAPAAIPALSSNSSVEVQL
ncbi:hypothetical protein [Paenibacillus koleovorans]|uniref:hypothetical protein n=1 Tax=Paenibacillus koleovorans TaxID=121608 RepID=UPI000FD87F2A|nr:hypothetical protein [Paenibacillus koleovorans]